MAAGLDQADTQTRQLAADCGGAQAQTNTEPRLARRPDLLRHPGLQQWQRYAGDSFVNAQNARQLVLQQIEQRHAQMPGEQFTLTFVAPGEVDLWPGGLTTVIHPATGQHIKLSLQVVGSDAAGSTLWRAEFSRLA